MACCRGRAIDGGAVTSGGITEAPIMARAAAADSQYSLFERQAEPNCHHRDRAQWPSERSRDLACRQSLLDQPFELVFLNRGPRAKDPAARLPSQRRLISLGVIWRWLNLHGGSVGVGHRAIRSCPGQGRQHKDGDCSCTTAVRSANFLAGLLSGRSRKVVSSTRPTLHWRHWHCCQLPVQFLPRRTFSKPTNKLSTSGSLS